MQYVGTARQAKVQNIAYTGTAGVIAAGVSVYVTKVRVLVTSDAWVRIDAPVANGGTLATTTTGMYMPAKAAEYFSITSGQVVSAIQDTAGGTLNVTECS